MTRRGASFFHFSFKFSFDFSSRHVQRGGGRATRRVVTAPYTTFPDERISD